MAAMNKSLGKLWVDDGFRKIHIERRGVIQLVEADKGKMGVFEFQSRLQVSWPALKSCFSLNLKKEDLDCFINSQKKINKYSSCLRHG